MHNPITNQQHPCGVGVQKIYRFDNNGYGASVVMTPWTYGGDLGLWELAVIVFSGDDDDKYDLTYDTHITDDVIGHLADEDVETILDAIAMLPVNKGDTGMTKDELYAKAQELLKGI